jgi:hypothetical protein
MASEDLGDVSTRCRRSSTKQLDMSLADDQVIASTKGTSEQDAVSDEDNPSGDTGDSENVSNDGSRV